jgi:hypothetical protein
LEGLTLSRLALAECPMPRRAAALGYRPRLNPLGPGLRHGVGVPNPWHPKTGHPPQADDSRARYV